MSADRQEKSDWWKKPLEQQLKEFGPDLRREDVEALRAWLDKQPHMPGLSDDLLGVFLAACGYSLEATKRALEVNYTLRTRYPRIFDGRDISNKEMETPRKYLQMGILPHRRGRPVVMAYAFRPMDASLYDLEVFLRASYMLQDVSNLLLGPAPHGYVYIFDMKYWTLGHILRSPLNICAAFLKYAQEGSCCRIHQIHFMNAGPILEKFLTMIRPFISQEVWSVMNLHEKSDGLEKYLEREEIPEDYGGGGAKSMEELTEAALRLLEEHREWFREEAKERVVEERRPPGCNSILDEGGLQGSFRKLDID